LDREATLQSKIWIAEAFKWMLRNYTFEKVVAVSATQMASVETSGAIILAVRLERRIARM